MNVAGTRLLMVVLVWAFALAAHPQAPDSEKLRSLLKAGEYARLDAEMSALQKAYRAGAIDDEAAAEPYYLLVDSDPDLRAAYDGWVRALPNSYAARLARGFYLTRMGYLARGTDYAHKTAKARMDDMQAYFKAASADLERSLKLDPRPTLSYSTLIWIAQGVGAPEVAVGYLDDAITLDQRVFTARLTYFGGLRPEWGGSLERMEAMLRDWKGSVSEKQYRRLQAMLVDAQWRTKLEPMAKLVEAKQYQQATADYSKVLEQTAVPRAYAMRGYSHLQLGENEKAIADYNRALELDPASGCCPGTRSNRARAYLKTGKIELALEDLRYAAARDDAFAARELAMIYAFGRHGFKRDYVAAKPYCERSAKQGDPLAMYCLGSIYHAGLGTPKDLPAAVYWFTAAGARGVVDAQTDAGIMYWQGEGVPRDPDRAAQWWRAAAAQGNQRAADKLWEHGYWWSYFRYVVLREYF
jgi:tetratricopeptide (TPR) repeat protein